jgi:Ala-tRNA(Pro) deacylase
MPDIREAIAHDLDGLPTTPEALLAFLAAHGIAQHTVEHPPVFTVEQAKALRGSLPGAHIKNLFVRNRREEMWLVVALEDAGIDLKRLADHIGAGRLSFGSAERLMRVLGVKAGSVTPFALINDREHRVRLVLDRAVLRHDPVNAHPLVNSMSTAVSPQGLLRFFEATGHPPRLIDLPI